MKAFRVGARVRISPTHAVGAFAGRSGTVVEVQRTAMLDGALYNYRVRLDISFKYEAGD